MKRLALPTAFAIAAALSFAADPARAEPACPVVTHNIKLTSDCKGPLVVAKSGVHVALKGHAVTCDAAFGDTGVVVTGLTGITIRRGVVTECGTGILLKNGGGHTLRSLQLVFNQFSLLPNPPRFDTGEDPNGEGVLVLDSDANELRDIDARRNSSGLVFVGSSRNRIRGGSIHDNYNGHIASDGVSFSAGSNDNALSGAAISGTGDNGVLVSGSDRNSVRGNVVTDISFLGAGFGIAVRGDSSGNAIEANTATGNHLDGIVLGLGATASLVRGNTAFGNAIGRLNLASDLRDENPSCDSNFWIANSFGSANQPCIG
jgi:parallel beta-helix repeat protein